MKKFFSVSVLVLLCNLLNAQGITFKESRTINEQTVNLLDSYMASIKARDAVAFSSLFTSGAAPVFCDLTGSGQFMGKMTASEYSSYLAGEIASISVSLYDVRKGTPVRREGGYSFPLTFSKSVRYFDRNGVMFDSDEYFDSRFDISASVLYSESDGQCRFEYLKGSLDSDRTFPQGNFLIINKTDAVREGFTVNGAPVSFNSAGQAFTSPGRMKLDSRGAKVVTDTTAVSDRYSIIQFKLVPRESIFNVHAAYAPLGAYSIKSTTEGAESSSSAFEFGFDAGRTFPLKDGAYWKVTAGLSFVSSGMDISAKGAEYGFDLLDSKGIPYKRLYQIDFAEEKLEFKDLAIPVIFSLGKNVNRIISLEAGLGVRTYLNLVTTPEPYYIRGRVYGQYSYGPEFSSAEGFGSLGPECKAFLKPETYRRSPVDISLTAGVGLGISIIPGVFSISAQASLEEGITSTYKASGQSWFSEEEGNYPYVWSSESSSDIPVRSLISSVKYRREALWLGAGITINF